MFVFLFFIVNVFVSKFLSKLQVFLKKCSNAFYVFWEVWDVGVYFFLADFRWFYSRICADCFPLCFYLLPGFYFFSRGFRRLHRFFLKIVWWRDVECGMLGDGCEDVVMRWCDEGCCIFWRFSLPLVLKDVKSSKNGGMRKLLANSFYEYFFGLSLISQIAQIFLKIVRWWMMDDVMMWWCDDGWWMLYFLKIVR